jgi:diguanylate cyclase (GGDEF)-like protein
MPLRKKLRLSVLVAAAGLATVAAALLEPPLGAAVAVALAVGVTADAAAHGSRRAGRAAALVAIVALGAGLVLGDNREVLAQWAVYAAAIVAMVEVVGARVAHLRVIAITDPLTGLLDRQGLWEAAGRAIAACRRTGRPLTLIHLDLDDFKAVNDSFGHAAGDRLLRQCAESWNKVIGAEDILARVGGDEFLLLLPGRDETGAEQLLECLRFRSPTAWSHGTAELRDGDDLDRCLLRADVALYAAKDRRRGRRGPGSEKRTCR